MLGRSWVNIGYGVWPWDDQFLVWSVTDMGVAGNWLAGQGQVEMDLRAESEERFCRMCECGAGWVGSAEVYHTTTLCCCLWDNSCYTSLNFSIFRSVQHSFFGVLQCDSMIWQRQSLTEFQHSTLTNEIWIHSVFMSHLFSTLYIYIYIYKCR